MSRRVADRLQAVLCETTQFVDRWPPDDQHALSYHRDLWYGDLSEEKFARIFRRSERNVFHFSYGDRRVTLNYHHLDRASSAKPLPTNVHLGDARAFRGTICDSGETGRWNMPATFVLQDVESLQTGERVDEAEVLSWSKGFAFGRPGDRVEFVARSFATHERVLQLVVPGFRPPWRVRILTSTDS